MWSAVNKREAVCILRPDCYQFTDLGWPCQFRELNQNLTNWQCFNETFADISRASSRPKPCDLETTTKTLTPVTALKICLSSVSGYRDLYLKSSGIYFPIVTYHIGAYSVCTAFWPNTITNELKQLFILFQYKLSSPYPNLTSKQDSQLKRNQIMIFTIPIIWPLRSREYR